MEAIERLREFVKEKRSAAVMTLCGAAGLLLIMISSFVPDKKAAEPVSGEPPGVMTEAGEYCSATEKRLADFLGSIEGAGEVRVYLAVGSNERYVYATEGRHSRSDNKTEEEEKYVMIGGGSDKSALVETIEAPVISGAVIVCSGGADPSVREQLYKAASAALGIPTGKIYVTKLE